MACVQCHSHPYDPIRHEDYFRSMAFFNNTEDADDNDYPRLPVPEDPEKFEEAHRLWLTVAEHQKKQREDSIKLAGQTTWAPIEIRSLDGSAELKIEGDTNIIRTEGTVPWNAEYKVKFRAEGKLSALRIEALIDEGLVGQANRGFHLSEVRLFLHEPDAEAVEIPLIGAFTNYFRPDSNPGQVLAGILFLIMETMITMT